MKINLNIPGWNNIEILQVLGQYAAQVPDSGNILELGALFGRSTYVLGHNKKPSVKLNVIEIWPTIYLENHKQTNFHDDKCGEQEGKLLLSRIKSDPDRLESNDFYSLWKIYTQGIPNLYGHKTFTNIPSQDFPMMDLIFHDAGHSYEDVYNDLNHWFPRLKHDGVIIIDDYDRIGFPDLCRAVDQFIGEQNLSYELVTRRNILLKRK